VTGNDDLFVALLAQEGHGGVETRQGLREDRIVLGHFGLGIENRHLDGQGRPAGLGQPFAQRVDDIGPVRVHTDTVNQDYHTVAGIAFRLGIDRQELVLTGLQVFRLADQDGIDDLIRPALLALQVGRNYRQCNQQQ